MRNPFRREQPQPKDEPRCRDTDLEEINQLHYSSRRMLRSGDKIGSMLLEHHRQKLIHKVHVEREDTIVRFDDENDCWYI